MTNLSRVIEYKVRTRSSGLRVQVERIDPGYKGNLKQHHFKLHLSLPTGGTPDFVTDVTPHFAACYYPEAREIQVESVERGEILPGQSYLKHTLSQALEASPRVDSIYLANVKHQPSKRYIESSPSNGELRFDVSQPGALITALFDLRFLKLLAVRESPMGCIGIRGYRERSQAA